MSPTAAQRVPRARQARLDTVLGAVCLMEAAACLLLLPRLHVHVAIRSLLHASVLAALLAALYAVYVRRDPRLGSVLRAALWGLVLSNVYAGPMYVAARFPSPLHDAALASADRALGIPAESIVAWAASNPVLQHALAVTYDSLIWLNLLALVVPPLLSQHDKTDELLLALLLGTGVSLAVLAVCPAVGPWTSEVLPASEAQIATGKALEALKAGIPVTLDFSAPAPIVSLPSWHTILAVVSAAALWQVPIGRVMAVVWAAAIVLSTVTTGWHYVPDVLAGVGVALVAQWLAARIVRTMTDTDASPEGRGRPG